MVQYVDYPLTHWVALDRTAPDTALLMVDAAHVETVAAIYGEHHFAHLAFSPHGAFRAGRALQTTVADFAAARPIPILFAGSFYAPQSPWWDTQPPVIAAIFRRAVELALAEEAAPALAALDVSLAEHGLDPTGGDVVAFRKLATHVHEHVRAARRVAALETAADLGLPIHVYGAGYEPHQARFRSFTFGGPADMAQVTTLMGASRLVLNVNANFGAGSHERPLLALAAGAAAATDVSSFYAERFDIPAELAVYRWMSLREDLAAIAQLGKDNAALHAMASAGHRRVMAEHGWDARIDAIVGAADAARPRLLAA